MSSDTGLAELAGWLQPFISALEPRARRILAARIADHMQREVQRNMRAQQAPDGTPWQERRQRITRKQSLREYASSARVRNAPMMVKLRQARYLHKAATEHEAYLTFTGRVLHVATVHHYGLVDKVAPGGPQHVYAERPLLGLSDDGIEAIRRIVIDQLQSVIEMASKYPQKVPKK